MATKLTGMPRREEHETSVGVTPSSLCFPPQKRCSVSLLLKRARTPSLASPHPYRYFSKTWNDARTLHAQLEVGPPYF